MSYGNEIATERYIEREIAYFRAKSMANKGEWITKDGRVLRVVDMTDSHISNCLAMLQRGNSPYAEPFICMFKSEQDRREAIRRSMG